MCYVESESSVCKNKDVCGVSVALVVLYAVVCLFCFVL